jgi:hypothetical protein
MISWSRGHRDVMALFTQARMYLEDGTGTLGWVMPAKQDSRPLYPCRVRGLIEGPFAANLWL